MKALYDHIEAQDESDKRGDGRECFICHASYYITPGLEDICGTCLDCAQEAVKDALRWRALVGCERVRVLGWAGLNDPESPYAHIGLELWTRHEFKDENAANCETLTRFADKALDRQSPVERP